MHKLDRLTRSVRDLAELLDLFAKKDVALISVSERLDTGTPVGRLMLNIMASVSQWEREAISERTSVGLAYKRRNSLCAYALRLPPRGRQLRPRSRGPGHPGQRAMRENGMTLAAIAGELTALGVSPARGARWYPSSVRAVLTSRVATEGAS